jgi:hypothetical protein
MSKTIQLKDREIQLNFDEIDNLDLESVLTIDYINLKDDIQGFPFVVNQLNFLVVEANSILNQDRFQLELLDSNLKEESAKLFLKIKKDLINKGEKSPTISLIESQIKLEDSYKQISESIFCQKQKIAEDEKNRDYLSGLYWAASSKMNLLVNLSKLITESV